MEVSSLGVRCLEPSALLGTENISSTCSRSLCSPGSNLQRRVWSRKWKEAGPRVLKSIACEHFSRGNQGEESTSGSTWGVQARAPSDYNIGRHSPRALSTLPVARPSGDTGLLQLWRLEEEIVDLKKLIKRLQSSGSLTERSSLIDSNRRVQALFGGYGHSGIFINPVIDLAIRVLGEQDLFLLKCMVAAGQEHVLHVPSELLAAFSDLQSDDEKLGISPETPQTSSSSGNPVKEAFTMLANFIRSCDDSSENMSFIPFLQYASPTEDHVGTSEINELSRHSAEIVNRFTESLTVLVQMLERMEKFYNSIGGIIGYQVAALELIKASEQEQDPPSSNWTSYGAVDASKKRFSVPFGPNLSKDKKYATQAASWGLAGLPEMAEIYPLGGAGDRLGLVDEVTGECLPVAMLPYCGRTLLEGLIRDLQAREYLYYKVKGVQHVTPVAIMTSAAKKNNERVQALCENLGWFGRGQHSFRLFEQGVHDVTHLILRLLGTVEVSSRQFPVHLPLVPTVAAADGHWMVSEPLTAVLKPGGHGVIWKLASDDGIFKWLSTCGRRAAIVRQISNPMAGMDTTLLALSGIGLKYNKKFGFASCGRNVGAAEGVNVLTEQSRGDGSWEYAITCIEYTEFSKLGIADVPVSSGSMEAQYPANTNVLYVDLASVERIASSQTAASLPGMILNLKKPTIYLDEHGVKNSVRGGRIECTMQNVADLLVNRRPTTLSSRNHEELDTFVIYNERRKVTSSAKRRRKPNDVSLHQTPDGSFLDVTRNAYDLLTSCRVKMPQMAGNHCYVDSGPPFIVLLHPAVGPLWDITRQKISGGSIAEGSELQLEIAELSWKNVQLDGSLLIKAENVMGSIQNLPDCAEGILQYGIGCGRCRLNGVQIRNKGIDWSCESNVYWQHQVQRLESIEIILEGSAEFEATNVSLEGSRRFEVPNGHRMCVTSGPTGLTCILEPLTEKASNKGTWYWHYEVDGDGKVDLQMVDT